MKRTIYLLLLFLGLSVGAKAQFYSLKTNAIALAAGSLNVEGSMTLSHKVSLHAPFQYNPWKWGGNKEFRHFYASPGMRYWFRQSYTGTFCGVHSIIAKYSIGNITDDFRYTGWAYGIGISYGKAYPIGKRWNMEWEVGVAGVYTDYDKRIGIPCGRKIAEEKKLRFIPSKISLSFVYLF